MSSKLRDEAESQADCHVARVFCDHQTMPGVKDYMDIVMSFWAQL